MSPQELAIAARSSGLTVCCVTEHDNVWDQHEAGRFASETGLPLLRGMEVTTDLGHILVFGLDRYVSGIRDPYRLRSIVQDAGGVMIAAHPFRNHLYHRPPSRFFPFDRLSVRMTGGRRNGDRPAPTIEEAAETEVLRLVDEVEVLNGATAELENFLALKVAAHLGFKGVASSDAHSVSGIGRYVTIFEKAVATVSDLVREMKAGRFYPAGSGREPYTVEALAPVWEERLQQALRA